MKYAKQNRGAAAAPSPAPPPGAIDRDLTAARLLDGAAVRIEQGWTTGAAARDEHHMGCCAHGERAVRWCATGALSVAEFDSGLRRRQGVTTHDEDMRAHDVRVRAEQALKLSAEPAGIEFITGWNDRRGQTAANVARAMRAAATNLRGVLS